MSVLTILAIIAALLAGPAAFDLIRRADFRRMGVRNAVRRPTETILIMVGTALGTAIIAAALLVGDTFDTSIRDIARRNLGEADLAVSVASTPDLERLDAELLATPIDGVDGHLAVRTFTVAIASGDPADPERPVEPTVGLGAADFARIDAFGSEPNNYSLRASAVPEPGQVVINDDLASDLEVAVGDEVAVFALGQELPMTVVDVVEATGLGGYVSGWIAPEMLDGFGDIDQFIDTHVLVSFDGTVFDSTDNSRAITAEIEQRFLADGYQDWELFEMKLDLITDAEEEGDELATTFSVVGGFSVLAGVLLLVNLFVMLAEERKPTLGVLRAIGWKRSSLRRAFRVEGLLYSGVAAVLGALLGIGVGWIIVRLTRSIIGASNPDSDFQLIFAAELRSLTMAALVGLIIAMGAIWFTSWRISRLNIISAIRDLPEPKTQRSRLLRLLFALIAVGLGALLLIVGVGQESGFAAVVSVPLIVVGVALALRDVVPPLVLGAAGGAAVLLWGVLFFVIMPSGITDNIDIEFFLLYGVVVVSGGVAVTTVGGPVLQRLLGRGERPQVEARVAMAYPTARLFRTASSLAMYSLIIFSLAFMAVLAWGFERQGDDIAIGTAAGHTVLVDSNGANPLAPEQAASIEGVRTANGVSRAAVDWRADFDPESLEFGEIWRTSGLDQEFAATGSLSLSERLPRFASDAEAMAAVAADPSLIMVPTWFLGSDDGFSPTPGDTALASVDGEFVEFEIAAIVVDDYAWSGVWMSKDALDSLVTDAVATRIYVDTDDDVDAAVVADRLEAAFVENGVEAESFADRVGRIVEVDLGFFSLLRGYLMLGLVIGIGGLAVTLFRAVRERRRQIGMLRAMGVQTSGIRRWFLTEATFVSLMGIITGTGLGVLTSYFVATRSSAIDDNALPFGIPWVTLGAIVLIPFVASGVAAIIPARRAAKLRPSEALRLAD